jgi:hypothetical protein
MAVPKKKNAVQTLAPNAISVVVNGEEVMVPADKLENAVMNMILASQARHLVQKALKKWDEADETPSPKELRDIAAAMRDIAQFSAEVYEKNEPISESEKKVEPAKADDVTFEELGKTDDNSPS